MYWPIGAPRVYAASNRKAPRDRFLESDDDAESRETTDGSGSLVDAPSNGSEVGDEYENDIPSGMSTPVTPMTPGIHPLEHDTQKHLSSRPAGHDSSISGLLGKEPLLSLKISRTGHLFAVITSTSLTIWQTKVCTLALGQAHR